MNKRIHPAILAAGMTPEEQIAFWQEMANGYRQDLETAEMRFTVTLLSLCFFLLCEAVLGDPYNPKPPGNPGAALILGCIAVTLVYKGIRKHLRETRDTKEEK
jgi:hypothetical protein